mgnify:CR=1 FL=1
MSVIRMSDLDLNGKRVLIREDLNVPVKNGKVTSDARLKAAIPTSENCTASGRYCLKCPPKTIVIAANNVAPDVSPIKSPVASGFLNNP